MTTASEPHCRGGPPALVSEHRRQPPARLCAHRRADSQRVSALPHPFQPDRCGDEPPDRGQSSAGPVVTRRRSQDRRTRRAGDRAQQGGKRGAALRAHGAPVRPDRPTLERPEQAADDHLGRNDCGTAAAAGRRDQHQYRRPRPLDPRDSSARRSSAQGHRQNRGRQRGRPAAATAGHGRYPVAHWRECRSRPQRPDRHARPATRSGIRCAPLMPRAPISTASPRCSAGSGPP